MTNTVSLNKIVSIFRDLSIRHKMIMDFGFGAEWNNQPDNRKYPYMYVEPISSATIISPATNDYHAEQYTFRISLMDRINKGDSNYTEILSDMDYILKTIITQMAQHQYYIDLGMKFVGDVRLEPAYEITSDDVNGWSCDMTLQMPLNYTPCNNPIEPLTDWTLPIGTDIYEYRLVGATGPAGSSGTSGSSGSSGSSGQDGTFFGSSGTSGVDGTSGSSGSSGKDGTFLGSSS